MGKLLHKAPSVPITFQDKDYLKIKYFFYLKKYVICDLLNNQLSLETTTGTAVYHRTFCSLAIIYLLLCTSVSK